MVISGQARKIATILTAEDEASSSIKAIDQAGDDAAESHERTEESTRNLMKAFAASAAVTGALAGSLGLLVRQHGETEQRFAPMKSVTGATEALIELQRKLNADLGG